MLSKRIGTGITATLLTVLVACGGGGSSDSPAPAPGDREISVSPQSGTHGSEVTVRASGFAPGARVGIGIGLPRSEYDIFAHATADAEGRVVTTVRVPDWTEVGRDYLFVAEAPGGDEAISSEFRVTGS